jgi:hypothetical protein
MNTAHRNGNKWTIPEILSLQREFELLEWSIKDIAIKHQRTEKAILYKLKAEGFYSGVDADENEELAINVIDLNPNNDVDNFSESDNITERVWNLENSVKEISSMVKQLFDSWVAKKDTGHHYGNSL